MKQFLIMCLVAAGFPSPSLAGQSAQATTAALYRTFLIQTAIERGTAFSIDVDAREYWITAKHLFTGVKAGPAGAYEQKITTVALLSQVGTKENVNDQRWITEQFRVIDPGKDIDILVLVPDHPLLPAEASLNSDPGGEGFGADCEFLGFPYGGGWKAHTDKGEWVWLPYVKHCTVSAKIDDPVGLWVLDGINNEGFSGGPVLYGTGQNQKVFAVISGFHTEPLEVLPATTKDGQPTGIIPPLPKELGGQETASEKRIVNANSGFIIAFDIQAAIDAIRKNPIGPLRTPSIR